MTTVAHETVLLDEAVAALVTDADGIYVDGTFGRGGHSELILRQLSPEGRLLATDKDLQALAEAERRFSGEDRFAIAHNSFADLKLLCEERDWIGKVGGVLLDLGVSSPQLDQAERGFSFLQDGPLDMRMDTSCGESAAQWVSRAAEKEIVRVLKEFGEERFAKRMARAILREREKAPIERTLQLAEIIKEAHPAWERGKHPATKAFQAIRIHINNELGDLQSVLEQALEVLAPGGRLVVISFHSLEDRLVKRFIRRQEKGDPLPKGLPVMDEQLNKRMNNLTKALRASEREVDSNVRSRSAIMRVAEKIK